MVSGGPPLFSPPFAMSCNIDLKIGRFAHADAGQMNLYLNYAREHWTLPGENPPIGLILSSEKNEAVAHYALGNLRNKVLSSEYKLGASPGSCADESGLTHRHWVDRHPQPPTRYFLYLLSLRKRRKTGHGKPK